MKKARKKLHNIQIIKTFLEDPLSCHRHYLENAGFNTDQGSQYTSADWLNALESRGIKVSMDGRGRWQDNVRMERFWRSFKYEHYFLHGSESLKEIRIKGEAWIYYYNNQRPHSKLSMLSPVMWSITQSQTCTTPPRRSFFQQACTPLRSVPAC